MAKSFYTGITGMVGSHLLDCCSKTNWGLSSYDGESLDNINSHIRNINNRKEYFRIWRY